MSEHKPTSNNTGNINGGKDTKSETDGINYDVQFLEALREDANPKISEALSHKELLQKLLGEIAPIDFMELAGLSDTGEDKLKGKHFIVCCVENVLQTARQKQWGICRHHDFIYVYNGAYWQVIDTPQFQMFLGEAAEKMGINKFDARYYQFREQLYKQFLAMAHLTKPEPPEDVVYINLKNGTFEISPQKQDLRTARSSDFLTYQLPFNYDEKATAPLFQRYLDRVQPDKAIQHILAEYLGYIFIHTDTLKLEKTLLLYGDGSNGKSVFFYVMKALLGPQNICAYSLQSLTDGTGYFRSKLADKLLNYATEINGSLETSIFKQLVSGEPVEARLPYGEPFILNRYAKLIFNCNKLPKDVEQTHAYFRRFLIVPFNVTIPDIEQDKELHKKIIATELSGVFNWVLEGLTRLLKQKGFTESPTVTEQIDKYRKQSDSVYMFIEEEGYVQHNMDMKALKDLFNEYKTYCNDSGYRSCSIRTFAERLRHIGFVMEKRNYGQGVYMTKQLA